MASTQTARITFCLYLHLQYIRALARTNIQQTHNNQIEWFHKLFSHSAYTPIVMTTSPRNQCPEKNRTKAWLVSSAPATICDRLNILDRSFENRISVQATPKLEDITEDTVNCCCSFEASSSSTNHPSEGAKQNEASHKGTRTSMYTHKPHTLFTTQHSMTREALPQRYSRQTA